MDAGRIRQEAERLPLGESSLDVPTEDEVWAAGVIGVKGIVDVVRDVVKSQKAMADYKTTDGEKKYLNHPEEKRARRRAERYRRDLNRGRAPLLIRVTTAHPPQP